MYMFKCRENRWQTFSAPVVSVMWQTKNVTWVESGSGVFLQQRMGEKSNPPFPVFCLREEIQFGSGRPGGKMGADESGNKEDCWQLLSPYESPANNPKKWNDSLHVSPHACSIHPLNKGRWQPHGVGLWWQNIWGSSLPLTALRCSCPTLTLHTLCGKSLQCSKCPLPC